MRRLALTTWSLHPSLGKPPILSVEASRQHIPPVQPPPALDLLDLPARMRKAGIGTLEICHFHLPSAQSGYLRELRAAVAAADVELFSVLIDAGDISHPDPQQRAAEIRLIESWIDVAGQLGAKAARVVAGEAPPSDEAALEHSITGLRHLADYAGQRGVRVLTENFRPLASTAANCNRILDALDGAIGLCADIGNFPAAHRLAEFAAVVPRAESIHCKASYDAGGQIVADELQRCLEASVAANFAGPYTLVYDQPGDEWTGIARLKEVVAPFTTPAN